MRLDRLRWPEWLIATSGVLLLVAILALPWYQGSHGSLNGWHGVTHLRWVLVVTVALALIAALAQAALRSPAIPVTLTLFAGFAGAASVVVLIYRVLADPPGGSRQAGGFVALVGALGILYASWESLRTDGVAEADGPGEIPVIRSVASTGVPPGGAPDS
jgi:hypothetical protein